MADLSTRYLGLQLKNPLVPSSSPLTGGLDSARQLEDAGASAIIMPSLFEEVIVAEQDRLDRFLDQRVQVGIFLLRSFLAREVEQVPHDLLGAFRLTDEIALVQTVDFFTPIVDDPYDFGAIAAANAFSDIYAMGGRPITALNIVGFPDDQLELSVLGGRSTSVSLPSIPGAATFNCVSSTVL